MTDVASPPGRQVGGQERLLRFAARRLLQSVVLLACVSIVVFLMVRMIPGDPALRVGGPDASPEQLQSIRERLGLDGSLAEQFSDHVRGLLTGDLGTSFTSGQEVSDVISSRLPRSLRLAGASLLVVSIGLPLGIVAAAATYGGGRRRFEQVFTTVTGLGSALPEYLAATCLLLVFAIWLGWAPVGGDAGLRSLVLPALAIGLRPMFTLARITRLAALDVLAQDYIRTARSKRLPAARLYLVHVLPNTLVAASTLLGILLANVVGGTVIIERVFAWPGLGSAVVDAVIERDYPLVQGTVLTLALLVVMVNLVVDLVIGVADPTSLVAKQEAS